MTCFFFRVSHGVAVHGGRPPGRKLPHFVFSPRSMRGTSDESRQKGSDIFSSSVSHGVAVHGGWPPGRKFPHFVQPEEHERNE